MNPAKRKLLHRLGAAKQSNKSTITPTLEEVKPAVEVVVVEEETTLIAEDTSLAQPVEVVESEVIAVAPKKYKKSV